MSEDATQIQLRRDYECLVLSGVKRLTDDAGAELLDAVQQQALERLLPTDLAARDGAAFVLRAARDANVELDHDTELFITTLHTLWLRLDDTVAAGDEVLYGELGYWQHWWNELNDGTDRQATPLRMDLMLPASGGFLSRQWAGELDPQIVEHVFSRGMVDIRVIVPPETHGALAETIVELSLAMGVQVRVFASSSEFSIYGGEVAVVRDEHQPGELERHRLVRSRAMVEPLVHLFEMRWASAVPWESFVRGSGGILQLMALGWTDARIAAATGLSPRTVSRRIAEMLQAAGAQSRFELGMKYALHEVN